MEINFENLNGQINENTHYYPVKVFYEDTDAGQIVYHSNYLKYFERARTSLLNLLKIDQISLKKNYRIILIVRNANVNWHKPAMLNDNLLIKTCLKYAKNSSIKLIQSAHRMSDNVKKSELLVTGIFQIVAVNDEMKVRRINKILKNEFFENK